MKNSILSSWQNTANKLFPWLAAILVLTAIVSPNGGQPVGALMFLAGIPLLFMPHGQNKEISQSIKTWWLVFSLPIIVSIPLFISSGTGEALAGSSRYLVAGITMLCLFRCKLDPMLLLRAASGAGILTILWNLDQFDKMRIDWGVGYLDSAYIGLLLLPLSLAQFHVDKDNMAWRLFSIIGIACLVVVIVKTGSRGAWPAMLIVFCLQFALLSFSRTRKVVIALAGVLLVLIAMFVTPSIKERLDLTVYEIQTYYENGNRASSMGYRLDFWNIAMHSFRDSPIYGVSYDRREELMTEYIEKYPQSHSIGTDGRSSSHNEILNAMSKRGIFGVLAILLIYLIPLRYFSRQLQRFKDPLGQNLAMAGGGCILAMMICGLTEAPMMNIRVGTTFAFFLIFLFRVMAEHSAEPAIS